MSVDPNTFGVDAILCDSAVTAEGKLFVQGGGWSTIGADSFPFVQARLSVALTVGVPYTATNQVHKLELALLNQDGDPVAPGGHAAAEGSDTGVSTSVEFNVGRPPLLQPGERQTLPFAVNFDRMRFAFPGSYSVRIAIDGEEFNRLEFRILGPVRITVGSS